MLTALLTSHLLLASPAIAVSVTGNVHVDTGAAQYPLYRFDEVEQGWAVVTQDDSSVELRFASGSLLRLGSNTHINITELEYKKSVANRKESMRLVVGRLWAKVSRLFGDDSHFQVKTPNAVAGIRGTTFVIESFPSGEEFYTLIEGEMVVDIGGSISVLNTPGATASVQGEAVATGQLTQEQTEQTQQENAEAGSTLIENVGQEPLDPPPAENTAPLTNEPTSSDNREQDRTDIVGPSDVVDTSTSTNQDNQPTTPNPGIQPVPNPVPTNIIVNINLPGQTTTAPSN